MANNNRTNRRITTHDPVLAKKLRQEQAKGQRNGQSSAQKWETRRALGQVPGLIRTVDQVESDAVLVEYVKESPFEQHESLSLSDVGRELDKITD